MNPQDIHVYYTRNTNRLAKACFDSYYNLLPLAEQVRIMNYKRHEDRQAALLGKALLIAGMKQLDLIADWAQLKRNDYGKPYLDHSASGIEFNISHSENYVVAAISNVPIGIDIEAIRPLDIADFENCFSSGEWRRIIDGKAPLLQFFTYWSIKEAVIKAAGKGLSIPLSEVCIGESKVYIDVVQYAFKELKLDPEYSLVLASPVLPQTDILPRDCSRLFDWD